MSWWQAVLPVVTLFLGYLGSLYTESRRHERTRELAVLERIADTKRDALIELQDILVSLPTIEMNHVRLINDALERGLPLGDVWKTQGEIDPDDIYAGNRCWALASRIRDDELRTNVRRELSKIIEHPWKHSERTIRREQTDIRWKERWQAQTDVTWLIGERLRSPVVGRTRGTKEAGAR